MKTKLKTTEIIRRYVKAFEELNIRVEGVVVFGSVAHGNADPQSDLDLLIISPDFAGLGLIERADIISSARVKARLYERPMDTLACTPEELSAAERGSFLGDEIKGRGILIRV